MLTHDTVPRSESAMPGHIGSLTVDKRPMGLKARNGHL